jgi:predicted dehydrogenase
VVEKGNEIVDHPMFLECHRLSPFRPRGIDVDVILDLMIHDIDLILKFVDSEVKNISAVGIPVITDKIDIANARISFENNSVANITASRISREVVRKMRIFQRDAYISLDFHRRVIEVIRPRKGARGAGEEAIGMDGFFVSQRSVLEDEEPLRKELVSFIDSIRTGRPPEATGEDGRKALSLAIRILEEIDNTGIPTT